MKKLNQLIFGTILFGSLTLVSCGSKSPEEFAKEYCNCMEESDGNLQKCKIIIEEAVSVHGVKNSDAQIKFREAARDCLKDI